MKQLSQEKWIGEYQIVQVLQHNQQKSVFLAKPASSDRHIALKLYASSLSRQPDFMEQFSYSLNSIKQLSHPNIVRIYTYGIVEKYPFIAMRYIEGETLADKIQTSLVALDEIEEALHQICLALDYAHEQGVIHGNLQPTNIFFDQQGKVYVSDFGLEIDLLQQSPVYLAPEQRKQGIVDERTDVYALGMVLFEWITGKTPYWSDSPLLKGQQVLPPLRIYRPEAIILNEVILRATDANPDKRYKSIKQFFQAVVRAIHVDISRRHDNIRPHPANSVGFGEYARLETKKSEQPSQNNFWLSVAGFVIGMVLMGLLISRFSSDTYSYSPAIIPDGYVLFTGQDVEIAVPDGWLDVNTQANRNMVLSMLSDVPGNAYFREIMMLASESGIETIQIFAMDPYTSSNVNINVTRSGYVPLEEAQDYLRQELVKMDITILESGTIELPVGKTVYFKSLFPIFDGRIVTHTYMVFKNNKTYTVTLTETTPADSWLFDVIIDTFRIKS